VFGDHVAVDSILPPAFHDRVPPAVGAFAMAGIDPGFATAIAAGDFIVAGAQFGAGSGPSLAVVALRAAGVAAVIARSFGGSFLDAATESGLPALVIEETGAIKGGDHLRVDIEARKIVNLSSGDRYVIRHLDDETVAILRAGGLGKPPAP
jgi:3-isopropylmalate/(R)-2-methylmalate dehydratase small subunit